jgi:4-carboxymuconolactone decarboxylase
MGETAVHPGRIPRLARDDLVNDAARELWDTITAGPGAQFVDDEGRMGGPFNIWLYTPEAGRHLFAVGGALLFETVLDRRLAELAICTTLAYWRANFSFAAHVPMAQGLGLSDDVLTALEAGEEPELADEREQVVHDLALMLAESGTVDEDLHRRAAACFGERELIELVITCAWYTMGAHFMNAFQVPMPAGRAPVWARTGRRDPARERS